MAFTHAGHPLFLVSILVLFFAATLEHANANVSGNIGTGSTQTHTIGGGASPFKSLPDPDLELLSSSEMQFFLTHGYVRLKTRLPESFHKALFKQLRHMHRDEFNPGNNILPRVDKIQRVLKDGAIRGGTCGLYVDALRLAMQVPMLIGSRLLGPCLSCPVVVREMGGSHRHYHYHYHYHYQYPLANHRQCLPDCGLLYCRSSFCSFVLFF